MQEAVPLGEGGMIAVMGSKVDELNEYIAQLKNKKVCEIANDNAEGQTIISGDTDSISSLKIILKEKKKIYTFKCKCTFSLFPDETSCK